jgi:hypothetical protein
MPNACIDEVPSAERDSSFLTVAGGNYKNAESDLSALLAQRQIGGFISWHSTLFNDFTFLWFVNLCHFLYPFHG